MMLNSKLDIVFFVHSCNTAESVLQNIRDLFKHVAETNLRWISLWRLPWALQIRCLWLVEHFPIIFIEVKPIINFGL